MKDIDQIRRENMAVLEQEANGPTAAAARLSWSQSQWSNLRSGAPDSKTGKPRGMRKETARRIEAAFERIQGWLDIDHAEDGSTAPQARETADPGILSAATVVEMHSAAVATLLDAITNEPALTDSDIELLTVIARRLRRAPVSMPPIESDTFQPPVPSPQKNNA